jgi:NTP pyrophosphatase (non-canonical NTP hydrolase)
MSDIETLNRYQMEALRTASIYPDSNIAKAVFTLGLAGEAAEILELSTRLSMKAGAIADIVKKEIGHGHSEDRDKMLKELGDELWYVACLADKYGFSLSEVATANIDKLKARYPSGFDSERSINRDA